MPFIPATEPFRLAELYVAATLYLDPSLHEGFGMQVVEAMACGTPVVCSDRGALPEVVGNAALLAEPVADTLAAAALQVLGDERTRQKLAVAGRWRARQFSWKRTAQVISNCIAEELARAYSN